MTIIASTYEAIVEAEQLRLAIAAKLARSAHERAISRFGKHSPVTARAAIVLAELLYEEGQCAGLEAQVMECLTAVRNSGDEDSAVRAYRVLVRLAAQRGDKQFAFLVLKEAEDLAAARDWAVMMAESLMMRAQLLGQREARSRCGDLYRAHGDTRTQTPLGRDAESRLFFGARAAAGRRRRSLSRRDDSSRASCGELRQAKQLLGAEIVGSFG